MLVILLFSCVAISGCAFAADNSQTIINGNVYTTAQIQDATNRVNTFQATYNRLPNYVTISGQKVLINDFLPYMEQNNSPPSEGNGKIGTVTNVTNGVTINGVTYTNAQIQDATNRVNTFQATYNRLPNYVTISGQKVLINDFLPYLGQNNNTKLSDGLRPIYIFSDNINNKSIDNNRNNLLVNALKSLGATAYNYGVGISNYKILRDTTVPSNALIVQINGGACAGTFVDMGSNYYKNLLGNRINFMVFTEGAKKITGLAWLERAHDDNFSPKSFKGLANPDQYLLNNGYNYYEGYTNSKVNELATIIYQLAST